MFGSFFLGLGFVVQGAQVAAVEFFGQAAKVDAALAAFFDAHIIHVFLCGAAAGSGLGHFADVRHVIQILFYRGIYLTT
jgi:hypothetical protein